MRWGGTVGHGHCAPTGKVSRKLHKIRLRGMLDSRSSAAFAPRQRGDVLFGCLQGVHEVEGIWAGEDAGQGLQGTKTGSPFPDLKVRPGGEERHGCPPLGGRKRTLVLIRAYRARAHART